MKDSRIGTQGKFLTALRMGHTVSKAAEMAAVHRRTVYDWRDQDQSFANAWDDAIETGTDDLEEHLRLRALDTTDPRSYLLLMFLLKKRRPEFKDNYKSEQKITLETVKEISFSEKEIDEAISILTSAKAPMNTSEVKVDNTEQPSED